VGKLTREACLAEDSRKTKRKKKAREFRLEILRKRTRRRMDEWAGASLLKREEGPTCRIQRSRRESPKRKIERETGRGRGKNPLKKRKMGPTKNEK